MERKNVDFIAAPREALDEPQEAGQHPPLATAIYASHCEYCDLHLGPWVSAYDYQTIVHIERHQ
jgi:hypothetical protein